MKRDSPGVCFIALPSQAASIARRLGPAGWDWCYLGSSVRLREKLMASFTGAERRSVSEELGVIARRCKQPFLNWLESLGRRQTDRVSWWATTLASRSPLQTDFFLLLCYAELVRGWLDGEGTSPALVVVEDPWLILMLERRFPDDPRLTFSKGVRRALLLDVAYWLVRAPAAVLATLTQALVNSLLCKVFIGRSEEPDNGAVLIHSWVDERCFDRPGEFRDSYTGRLEDLLRSRGESVHRITAWHIDPRTIRRLKPFAKRMIVGAAYLKLADIAQATLKRARIEGLDSSERLLGWDPRFFVRREVLREWGHAAYTRHHLAYLCYKRVAGRLSEIKAIVFPFENHPWEKMMCLAWRETARGVRLVGYQHSIVPPLQLNYFLGEKEREIMPLPDVVVANSKANEELLAPGYPKGSVVNGGAFRYEYFYFDTPIRSKTDARAKRILIVLPMSRSYAFSLFFDVVKEMREPLAIDDGGPVQFVFKCHPRLPLSDFFSGELKLPSWFSFSDRPMKSLIEEADVLLYAPQTVAWWEGFSAGVPVLKYQTDLLDIDSDDELNGAKPATCTRENLRSVIATAFQQPRRPKPSDMFLQRFFGKVDESLWVKVVR